ncbi:MAG TPA: twin-arginine translocase TatA/TatE family subunit [Trueperaceae bacterium]|jgi:sec-independent protein translocase protein TatA
MPRLFGSIGLPEILILLVIVLLVFGPRRLPEMAKGLGQSVREFRKGLRDMRKDIEDDEQGAKGAAVSAAATNPPAPPAPQGQPQPVEAATNGERA